MAIHDLSIPWPATLLSVPWGLAVGVAYFLALRHNARLYLAPGPIWRPLALLLARMFGAAAALGGLVWVGWAPALAGLAGFSLARPLVVRLTAPGAKRWFSDESEAGSDDGGLAFVAAEASGEQAGAEVERGGPEGGTWDSGDSGGGSDSGSTSGED